MSTLQAVGSVITDGLVLYLDAANYKSYPGSGTTWSDLTINKNNGTLTNGPTFSSANAGSIVFDGTNDYTLLPNIGVTNLTAFTVSFWAKITDGAATPAVYSEGTPSSFPSNLFIIYCGDTSIGSGNVAGGLRVWFGYPTVSSPLNGVTDLRNKGWKYITYIQTSTSNRSIYINTVLEATNTTNITSHAATNASIGGINNAGVYQQFFNGNLALLTCYNRAITQAEMLQNYNALKRRFNL